MREGSPDRKNRASPSPTFAGDSAYEMSPAGTSQGIDPTQWNIPERAILPLITIPFVLAAAGLVIASFRQRLFHSLALEDSLLENIQVLILVLTFVFCLKFIRPLRGFGHHRLAFAYVCAAIGLVLLIGEELDWGQRVFGWVPPGWWSVLAWNNETSLHDLRAATPIIRWSVLCLGGYGSIVPLLVSRTSLFGRYRQQVSLLVPPSPLIPYFLIVMAWGLWRRFGALPGTYQGLTSDYAQVVQLILYLGLCLFVSLQWSRVKASLNTNRLVSRDEAAHMELALRIKLEMQLTDEESEKLAGRSFPVTWSFDAYRDRSPWRRHLFDTLGPLSGRSILDLGCGYNPTPVYLALAGAKKVYACDVSPKAVAYARRISEAAGVGDRVVAFVSAGEQLPLADETIDIIHAESVLHHLQLPLAGRELSRVLRKDGRAGFKDPLGANPVLEFVRDYFPYHWKKSAKGTDRPLRFHDICKFGEHFSSCTFKGFGFLSMIVVFFMGRNVSTVRKMADALDEFILTAIPPLRRYCRFVVTCVRK